MNISSFLYRRLSSWVTCEFNISNGAKISLKNKYEIASFQDVFCHPFYWQIYQWIDTKPKLIVDCGAHCGHFTILVNSCICAKFHSTDTKYILIEPNPRLIPIIEKNILQADLQSSAQIKQGLLGRQSGTDTLWVHPKNYLSASLHPSKGAEAFTVSYLDINQIVGTQNIDVMKIDIEGGEFDFVRANLDIFRRVKLVFIELHQASDVLHKELLDSLDNLGLHIMAETSEPTGHRLLILSRKSLASNL
ncbi:MAG: FkbM family methyltransferase [Cyanobacteria bacterium J06634_6]